MSTTAKRKSHSQAQRPRVQQTTFRCDCGAEFDSQTALERHKEQEESAQPEGSATAGPKGGECAC